VAVALVVAFVTAWSDDVKTVVAAVIAGTGAGLILFRRMQKRP
jgi:hypothetical protein